MKHILSMFAFIVACFFTTSTVQANINKEPLIYGEVPLFYTKTTLVEAPCTLDRRSLQGVCGWASYPTKSYVFLSRRSTPDIKHPVPVNMYVEIVCVNGICKDKYDTLHGVITSRATSYWEIPVGYYLTDSDGKYIAYKHGNGFHAKVFPIKDVNAPKSELDGYSISLNKTKGIYNVSCNTELERCNYLGKEFTLMEIAQIIPFVKTMDCDLYLCYLDNTKLEVAGINPDRRNYVRFLDDKTYQK